MHTVTQYNTVKTLATIEQDIKQGSIHTVKQLLARTGQAKLPYSVYCKLLKQMRARS